MRSFARRLLPILLLAVACRSTAPVPVPPLAAPLVEEPPLSNTLRWSTASEVDNFGFDVYRGPSEEGPFERLTADPIPGAGTTDTPSQYSYVDSGIEPDTTYYYYVESISLQGVREQFTPIIQAAAKRPESAVSASEEGEPQQ
jgi:hypothetical protein